MLSRPEGLGSKPSTAKNKTETLEGSPLRGVSPGNPDPKPRRSQSWEMKVALHSQGGLTTDWSPPSESGDPSASSHGRSDDGAGCRGREAEAGRRRLGVPRAEAVGEQGGTLLATAPPRPASGAAPSLGSAEPRPCHAGQGSRGDGRGDEGAGWGRGGAGSRGATASGGRRCAGARRRGDRCDNLLGGSCDRKSRAGRGPRGPTESLRVTVLHAGAGFGTEIRAHLALALIASRWAVGGELTSLN